MTTNIPGTRPVNRTDGTTVVEEAVTPVVTPSGVGSVAVYDRDADAIRNPSLRPSATMAGDPLPVETRPVGSILSWIIGAIVLIVLAYFLLQLIF